MSTTFRTRALPLPLLCLVLSTASLADAPLAEGGRQPVAPTWGLGLQLGTPTGLTLKRYLGRDAIAVYAGGLFGPGLRVGADVLWGAARLTEGPVANLDLYAGFGVFYGTLRGPCAGLFDWQGSCNGDDYQGARVPIGVEWLLKRTPFSLGVELAPGFARADGRAGFLLDVVASARLVL